MEILLVTTDWTSVGGGESCMQIFSHGVEWWDCRREKESQAGVQISRCTKLLHAMIKAGHNGGILAGIMHTGIANMLMWQRIKEERGVRVTSVHACIGKHIFCGSVSCIGGL